VLKTVSGLKEAEAGRDWRKQRNEKLQDLKKTHPNITRSIKQDEMVGCVISMGEKNSG
jgi:hypothetical protein